MAAEKSIPGRLIAGIANLKGSLLALLLSFLISSILILLSGVNPVTAFAAMLHGAFGSVRSVGDTLTKATPLLLAATGLMVSYRTGLVSVGSEGQLIIGGLCATIAGVYLPFLPGPALIAVMALAGAVGGGIWGAVPGYLKARLGVSEVINTIMMNYLATYLLSYLLDVPLREPPGYFPQSSQIAHQAWLPRIVPGTRLHLGFVIALAGVLVAYWILWRTPLGFQMRAVGYNRIAAESVGIKIRKNLVLAMFISGAFAGLAGMSEIGGIHHRLQNGFSSEYGFDAMAVALLGRTNPAGVVVASIFFGALRVGAGEMQRVVQVPASLVFIIQGCVIVFVLMETLLSKLQFPIRRKAASEGRVAACR